MGGKLLNTTRIPKSKYFELITELSSHFNANYKHVKYHFPRTLPTKADYGDVDVLLFCTSINERINPKQDDLLKPTETIQHSSKMESFVYKETQIDFIWFNVEVEYEMAKVWFDYGDLSMLLGMLWKRLGCKFTDIGLILKQHSLHLSSSPPQIYSYLGLDFTKWKQGFKSTIELAEWIATSRFFHPSFYELDRVREEGNQNERRRSTKRSMQIEV